MVPASAFRHVLGTDPRVTEYQVIQTATGVDVLVVGDPDVDSLSRAIVSAARRYGLTQPEVSVRVVARLERHRSTGKLKRFVPLG